MYIPNSFNFDDRKEIISFMKRYSFATIINTKNGLPIATQLPFSVAELDGKLFITSHFAKSNEQSVCIEDQMSLIIFTEPQAYISPSHYDKRESVPTWDYIAVHAYGRANIIRDEQRKINALKDMIVFYEKDYLMQWNSLSDRFKLGMMNGIVAFEIEIEELQAQKKLSQNKTAEERRRIAEHLEQSKNTSERDIAKYIKSIKK